MVLRSGSALRREEKNSASGCEIRALKARTTLGSLAGFAVAFPSLMTGPKEVVATPSSSSRCDGHLLGDLLGEDGNCGVWIPGRPDSACCPSSQTWSCGLAFPGEGTRGVSARMDSMAPHIEDCCTFVLEAYSADMSVFLSLCLPGSGGCTITLVCRLT